MARTIRYFVKGSLQERQENKTRAAQRGDRYRDGCSILIAKNACHCTVIDGTIDPLCADCVGTGIRRLSEEAKTRNLERV